VSPTESVIANLFRGPGLAHLVGLRNLRRLDLGHTRITGPHLAHVAKLQRLEWLNLVFTRAETSNVAIRHRPAYSSSVTDDSPKDSPTLEALGKAVQATTRYGWLILAGALIVLGVLGWLPWATLVWIGLVGAGLIALSPIAFGVVVAIDSRRRQSPPEDPSSSAGSAGR
jgi:hypothetical protein